MRESLRGYALGVLYLASQSGKSAQIKDELDAFGRLLGSQELLADVISDPSISSRKRQAILDDLLSSKVDPLVVRLLATFVGTENPRSVVESIFQLTRMLRGDDGVQIDGGMATSGRIAGFSQALLESLDGKPDIAQVEDELFRFARTIETNSRLRRVLSGIGSDSIQRRGIVADLLSTKSHPVTLEIALFAAASDRLRDFVEVLDAIVARAAEIRNRKVANVRSAIELSPSQIDQISQALTRATGTEVEMRTSVDPSLIGGVVAVVGDTIFDGSIRNRIEQLRVRLGLPATVKSRERI